MFDRTIPDAEAIASHLVFENTAAIELLTRKNDLISGLLTTGITHPVLSSLLLDERRLEHFLNDHTQLAAATDPVTQSEQVYLLTHDPQAPNIRYFMAFYHSARLDADDVKSGWFPSFVGRFDGTHLKAHALPKTDLTTPVFIRPNLISSATLIEASYTINHYMRIGLKDTTQKDTAQKGKEFYLHFYWPTGHFAKPDALPRSESRSGVLGL